MKCPKCGEELHERAGNVRLKVLAQKFVVPLVYSVCYGCGVPHVSEAQQSTNDDEYGKAHAAAVLIARTRKRKK